MKRPSFQFYPADWRNDANLRRCSPAARGVWMDLLCVLHDADQYGVVRWPLKELASAAGASIGSVRELVEKNVLKGCEKGDCAPLIFTPRHGRKEGAPVTLIAIEAGPIWYSSRFVRDEYVRTIRGEASRFGAGDGEPPKPAPKPPFGDGPPSSSSSSPSGSVTPSGVTGGADAPPDGATTGTAVDQRKSATWRAAKSFLHDKGMAKEQTGTYLGALHRDYRSLGDDAFLTILEDMVKTRPAEPQPWLTAAFQRAAGARITPNKQAALEASNDAVVQAALAKERTNAGS